MNFYDYTSAQQRFEGLSRSFGIGALVCAFFFSAVPFIPIGLGFLAILFAILSKGYALKLGALAKNGIICGIAAIAVSLFISVASLSRLMLDSEYRETTISTMETFYGSEYEELYGIDIREMFDTYLPEIKK